MTGAARAADPGWDAIEPVLDRALELAPDEQDAFLRRTGSEDPALEAAVRRLLEAGRRAGDFLEQPAAHYAGPLLAWAVEGEPVEPGTLVGSYEIVRRLGRGATATVYLARDPKHRRAVAVKVLHRDLAAALGAERFLREIEFAATLQHPHILPLFDSGATDDGLLYYVMPHVEGESLRGRIQQGKPLPLHEAVRIAREVAGALDYSHRRGVVHRDIKPENILLQDGQAIVADFGIARAIDAADPEGRAEPATGTGTPAYMSPEQLAPGSEVDGRSDIYSRGCVVYEMIAGRPPYAAATRQEVYAHHQAGTSPPPLRSLRPGVPASLELTVARALAPSPTNRFATAHELEHALASVDSGARRPPGIRRVLAGAIVVALFATASVAAVRLVRQGPPPARLDAHLVAVLPFRVSGGDRSLKDLEDGFADLLAVQLTGEGGLRAAEPRAVRGAWRGAPAGTRDGAGLHGALRVARQLGAGRVVDGAITGSPHHLIVTASMLAGESGRVVGRSSAEGPLDSLGSLVSRIAAELLANQAGERKRLNNLSSLPLPALRAYLDGQGALRQGQWDESVQRFSSALDVDSTFAQAALGLAQAAGWASTGDDGRGARLAWAHRDRLSAQDRALFSALMGPRYPGLSSQAERVDALERLVRVVPDRPDVWFQLGDAYYHWGSAVQMAHPRQLAATAFRHALELDSSITRTAPRAEPLIHLFQVAANEGDTTAVRRLAGFVPAGDSGVGDLRWRAAWALNDTVGLRMVRAGLGQMSARALEAVVTRSLEDGLPLDDAERAVTAMLTRATTQDEIGRAQFERYLLSMSSGRPAEAVRALGEAKPGTRFFHGITGELYWAGDSAFGRAMARAGAVRADAPLTRVPEEVGGQFWDICWVERWRVAHGELRNTRRAIARLRSAVPMTRGGVADSSRTSEFGTLCADVLEASLATAKRDPAAPLLVSRLNDRLRTVPPGWTYGDNLAVARLLAASGNYADALAAVRRRQFDLVPVYLSTYLREEGRFAALAGDTVGAISAYRRFLTMQAHPEPLAAPGVEEVRAELARLEGRGPM